jgi:hypothetical protein
MTHRDPRLRNDFQNLVKSKPQPPRDLGNDGYPYAGGYDEAADIATQPDMTSMTASAMLRICDSANHLASKSQALSSA